MNTALDRSGQAPKLPPMLTQYLEYKTRFPDAMLFFQVGDFYELFFDDAVTVAKTLNLTLTSRDKGSANPIPMCGVPIAVIDGYLERLVDRGFSAAIVSQVAQDGAAPKGMFTRRLERIITPAVRILGNAPGNHSENILAALMVDPSGEMAIAFSEVQSASITVREGFSSEALIHEIQQIAPVELILPHDLDGKRLDRRFGWVRQVEQLLRPNSMKFRALGTRSEESETRQLGAIAGYASLSGAAKRAVKLLLRYLDEATVERTLPIGEIAVRSDEGTAIINATTRANLELVKTLRDGAVQGSLFGYMDRAKTDAGSKLLCRWILHPLTAVKEITERQDVVALFRANPVLRDELRDTLGRLTDLERIAARLELGVAVPRELGALRDTIAMLPNIAGGIAALVADALPRPRLLEAPQLVLEVPKELREKLEAALVDSPPLSVNEGEIMREGFNAELDRLRSLHRNGKDWIAQLEARERERTGISSLRVRFNNVIGFFIEITKANAARVPEDYLRRQNTANGDRFTTEELKKLEQDVLGAESAQHKLERSLYEQLRGEVRPFCAEIRRAARSLAMIDVLASLAHLADEDGLVRPVVDDTADLVIEGGKHPVLAAALRGGFVPNSLDLQSDGARCAIITGPNMGGKSTYLRQSALAVIMAQIGSCIAATSARIGVADKIFARIGAADNPAEGDSTFMVEMREAAHIIHSASGRSLVLIDEIGRGTATTDGLSIAQAVLEWIVTEPKCRTLFATHFHELTELEGTLKGVINLSVASVDGEDGVVFTHQIKRGAANRSYGLEVARLAGLPPELLARAGEVFHELENQHVPKRGEKQLSIFSRPAAAAKVTQPPADYAALKALSGRLKDVAPDMMTPIEALQFLDSLVRQVKTAKDS